MHVPVENGIAAFPPSRTAGNVVLRPLTLAGAIRLGCAGVDCGRPVPRDRLFEAAFILSGLASGVSGLAPATRNPQPETRAAAYRRFLRRARCGLKELSSAVEGILNDAFATWVKPARAKGNVVRATPYGLGWPLELAESLCAEYGWRWQEALDTPVVTVWALVAAARQRKGGRHGGIDYIERWYSGEVKAGRAKPLAIDK